MWVTEPESERVQKTLGNAAALCVVAPLREKIFSTSEVEALMAHKCFHGLKFLEARGMVNDMTEGLRQTTFEAFEQLSGGPFKTLEREALKRALRTYNLTYNVKPTFLAPDKLVQGASRGGNSSGN